MMGGWASEGRLLVVAAAVVMIAIVMMAERKPEGKI